MNKLKLLKRMILTYILFCTFSVFGQDKKTQLLTVGDKIPNMTLKGFLKDNFKQSKIEDYYKGKLFIIDLSATWCVPCVQEWIKIDSIKKLYSGRFDAIIVSQESAKTMNTFFNNHQELNCKMDVIADNVHNNPILFKAFPHKTVPELIWIAGDGKIIAITDGDKLTSENLEKGFSFKPLDLVIKKDVMDFRPETYSLPDSDAVYRSIITHFKPGLSASSSYSPLKNVDEVRSVNRLLLTNLDVKTLYWYAAFHHSITMSNSSWIVWDMPDSVRLKYDRMFYERKVPNGMDYQTWGLQNGYCYQIETKSLRPFQEIRQQMINDLNIYLRLNGRFEKRTVECWVLKRVANSASIISNGGPSVIHYHAGIVDHLENQPISKIIYFLNKYLEQGIIIDETNIENNIDLDLSALNGEQNTPEMLNKILNKFNLKLEKGHRQLEIFVISVSQ